MQLTLLLYYALNDDVDDAEPKVGDAIPNSVGEHETNCVSPTSTGFQPDIQSLASSALLFPTLPWQRPRLGGCGQD
jgi:hypothetical protein